MQSERLPEIETDTTRIQAYKSLDLDLPEGIQLRFLMVANPVKKITDEQGRLDARGTVKKCRVPLISEDSQVVWLKRKLVGAVLVGNVDIEKKLPLNFRRGGKLGKIQPFVFKGILQVNNTSALRSLMQRGIGPAKAFGCGMLSLAAI